MGRLDRGMGSILWVGDDQFIVECGQRALEQLGFVPLTARFGSEAINIFVRNQDSIRLVVFDMMDTPLKVPSSVDKIFALKPDLKALIITGSPYSKASKRFSMNGDIDFIGERFTRHALSRKIGKLLNGNASPKAPRNTFDSIYARIPSSGSLLIDNAL